jgi:hypothetical protein
MSLRRALDKLPGDRGTEAAVREVLQLLRVRKGEHLSTDDVSRRVERPLSTISVLLSELADARVLHLDGTRYAYLSDPVTDLEVERFLRRAESHSVFVQANVAKFRERYGTR